MSDLIIVSLVTLLSCIELQRAGKQETFIYALAECSLDTHTRCHTKGRDAKCSRLAAFVHIRGPVEVP
jgi:hypothetical protein